MNSGRTNTALLLCCCAVVVSCFGLFKQTKSARFKVKQRARDNVYRNNDDGRRGDV